MERGYTCEKVPLEEMSRALSVHSVSLNKVLSDEVRDVMHSMLYNEYCAQYAINR